MEDDPGGGFVRGTRDAGPVGAFGGGLDRAGKGGVSGTNDGAPGLNFPLARFSVCSSRDGVEHVDGMNCEESGLNGCVRVLVGGVTVRFRGGVLDTIAGDITFGWNEVALGFSIVDVDWSLFVEVGAGSFRDITVEVARVDFARLGVSDLFVRVATVRGFADGKFNWGRVGTDPLIICGGGGDGELGADTGGVRNGPRWWPTPFSREP